MATPRDEMVVAMAAMATHDEMAVAMAISLTISSTIIFNKYFQKKITLLRQKTATASVIEPATSLRDWLSKRAEPPPKFKIKKINLTTLRKAINKMKGKRVHGRDEIDSAPLIEDSLLHLVNLSIENQNFAAPWKPQLILPLSLIHI